MLAEKYDQRIKLIGLYAMIVDLRQYYLIIFQCLFLFSCAENKVDNFQPAKYSIHSCLKFPVRFSGNDTTNYINFNGDTSISGMIFIQGGEFNMGGDNEQAESDELPKHIVIVSSFYIDVTEVTNFQFRQFINATGYITTAERKPDWEQLKKELPPGTPIPPDSLLTPSSLVFKPTQGPVDLNNYNQWWTWKKGANWLHPDGPESSIFGKENHPVVHVSWEDAVAYCKWAGKRLPTEAEWEYAARGGLLASVYPWGNEALDCNTPKANTWEGKFPYYNSLRDGFLKIAPVASFSPNGYGLHDMAGNVWEWCSDWYDYSYYESFKGVQVINPKGPLDSYDPQEPFTKKRVLRGGSFLCNDTYCSGYRVSRRMKTSPDTGMEHIGFRCVKDIKRSKPV